MKAPRDHVGKADGHLVFRPWKFMETGCQIFDEEFDGVFLPCQSRERQLFMGRRAPLPEIAGVKLPEGTRYYLP